MTSQLEVFNQMKDFVGFGDADAENLKKLAPIFEQHGPELTARLARPGRAS